MAQQDRAPENQDSCEGKACTNHWGIVPGGWGDVRMRSARAWILDYDTGAEVPGSRSVLDLTGLPAELLLQVRIQLGLESLEPRPRFIQSDGCDDGCYCSGDHDVPRRNLRQHQLNFRNELDYQTIIVLVPIEENGMTEWVSHANGQPVKVKPYQKIVDGPSLGLGITGHSRSRNIITRWRAEVSFDVKYQTFETTGECKLFPDD